ncbi:MAG: hypothetical protein ACRD4L_10370, partial [Pyrinomonadaceae bacterium]
GVPMKRIKMWAVSLTLLLVLSCFPLNPSLTFANSNLTQVTTLNGEGGADQGLEEHALSLLSMMANILLMSMKF